MNREEMIKKLAATLLRTTEECEHESEPSCCRYPKPCICAAEEDKREERLTP